MSKLEKLKINDNATLTTNHPASSYGIPVLVTLDGRGYGPSEKTHPARFDCVFGDMRAAHSVYSFAISADDLTSEEAAFIRLYLGQWPEGPQLPCFDVPMNKLETDEKKSTSVQVDPKLKDEPELER